MEPALIVTKVSESSGSKAASEGGSSVSSWSRSRPTSRGRLGNPVIDAGPVTADHSEDFELIAAVNSDEDEDANELENVYINVLSDDYRFANDRSKAIEENDPNLPRYLSGLSENEDENVTENSETCKDSSRKSDSGDDVTSGNSPEAKLKRRQTSSVTSSETADDDGELTIGLTSCTLPSELNATVESKSFSEGLSPDQPYSSPLPLQDTADDSRIGLQDEESGRHAIPKVAGISWVEKLKDGPGNLTRMKKSGSVATAGEDGTVRAESRSTGIFSRNASRLALESREAMFQKAMTLLSARCTSVHHEASQTGSKDQSYGQYLLIKQEKPLPMPPLKAWRGYNGNVYFEPINILPMKSSRSSRENEGPMTIKSAPSRTQTNKKRALSDQQAGDSRTNSQQTNKSSQGSVPPGTRQMVLMDKQAVLTRFNEHLQEDVVWLEGQENTGSLAIKPRQNRERSQTALLNKKLCKGSVAHKLHVENEAKRQPALTVSGGKFVPPASLSPLLRAQTQYSLSSHRLTTNSPDLFHLNQDNKLPPLEQIRASLKHEQAIPRPKTYTRPVTITNERKPLVKYSPDVLAKFNQQANIC